MRIVVMNHITLDGVMQSPGRVDEDTRDGFDQGGWATTRSDDVVGEAMGERMAAGGGLAGWLFGRRTYEELLRHWNSVPDSPFAESLNNARKYVASTTLREPLPWPNSTLLEGDAADAVAELKAQGKGFVVFGSGELVRALARRGLVDTYVLMIHPLVLGTGARLFTEDSAYDTLELAESVTTKTGVVVATYHVRRDA